MNLLYIFLSLYLSIFLPTVTNNESIGQDGKEKISKSGEKKSGNNGDFIISNDSHP